MCVYIYIYIYTCVCVYVCVYAYLSIYLSIYLIFITLCIAELRDLKHESVFNKIDFEGMITKYGKFNFALPIQIIVQPKYSIFILSKVKIVKHY